MLKRIIGIYLKNSFHTSNMAKSKFEYVKKFETDEKLLSNCWIIVRIDGKGFHKFSNEHNFEKPNDSRALHLMNRSAVCVMEEFKDIVLSYGQSDEYSFIFRKETEIYNRRSSKLLSYVNSIFSSSYVFFWSDYFDAVKLKYPPSFDARIVLYPSDDNLKDYLSWRQADVHVNNLYNTAFWNLVLKGKLSNNEAEKRLSGTLAADKNELLFSVFGVNYNNEPAMFRKGTVLMRKNIKNPFTNKLNQVIIPLFEDMISNKFWSTHDEILSEKKKNEYKWPEDIPLPQTVLEQFKKLSIKINVPLA